MDGILSHHTSEVPCRFSFAAMVQANDTVGSMGDSTGGGGGSVDADAGVWHAEHNGMRSETDLQ